MVEIQTSDESQEAILRGKRVLVVDDFDVQRRLLTAIFTNAGMEVITANDGREALTLIQDQPFDIVVSDIDMPEMTGIELVREVRALGNTLPMVLVSGSHFSGLDRGKDRKAALRLGANDGFRKPYRLNELQDTLVSLLQVQPDQPTE